MISHNVEPAFDPTSDVYRLDCDWHAVDQPGLVIVEAVASVLSRDVLDLQPLQDVVDIDSLESLLRAPARNRLSLEFEYENTIVELSRAGQLIIDVL